MLLTDWMTATGVPVPRGRTGHLNEILRFVFGEHYLVQMKDGRSFEDKTLDPILEIMADEFRVHNTTRVLRGDINIQSQGYFPKVEMLSVGANFVTGPIGKKSDVSLVVSVVQGWPGPLPPPDIECVVQMVREAVTFFSLTGEWSIFKKDNL